MTRKVKFYWWKSCKIWNVSGRSIGEITEKANAMCDKYHAIHFEIL